MKKNIDRISFVSAAALGLAAVLCLLPLAGCSKEPSRADGNSRAAAMWHCPMHPSVIADRKGSCKICGMDLVPADEGTAAGGGAPAARERRILFYRSPMNPALTSPVPRKDEMGMEYVPVWSDEGGVAAKGPAGLTEIRIDSERRQAIGIRTVAAERGPLATTIRTTGRVAFDETRVHHVHMKFEAYIEHVHADFVGKYVRKGEPLASYYSPDLHAAQQEYLIALEAKKSLAQSKRPDVAAGAEKLLDSARQRLLLWDVSPKDIAELEASGEPNRTVNIVAPISGYVVGKNAVHGMKVDPGMSLFDIADLSQVWAVADIYEYELPGVRLGQEATMTLSYWTGRKWKGRVTYVYPTVDEKSRTVKVRLEFANPNGELKPEMFADVVLAGSPRTLLRIPDDAVLDSGVRKIAFVDLGDGRLAPREVETGIQSDGFYEVRSGISEGEQVVTGANFLVDSESRLRAAIAAISPPGSASASAATKEPAP